MTFIFNTGMKKMAIIVTHLCSIRNGDWVRTILLLLPRSNISHTRSTPTPSFPHPDSLFFLVLKAISISHFCLHRLDFQIPVRISLSLNSSIYINITHIYIYTRCKLNLLVFSFIWEFERGRMFLLSWIVWQVLVFFLCMNFCFFHMFEFISCVSLVNGFLLSGAESAYHRISLCWVVREVSEFWWFMHYWDVSIKGLDVSSPSGCVVVFLFPTYWSAEWYCNTGWDYQPHWRLICFHSLFFIKVLSTVFDDLMIIICFHLQWRHCRPSSRVW